MRRLVILAALAVIAGAVVVAIERGRTGDDVVGRSSVTAAFARVGEPLTIRIDFAQADPQSPTDVIYVPEADDTPQAPFEVDDFKQAASARERARFARSVAGASRVEQRKNVLLILSASLPDERRERVSDALRSL